MKVKNILLAGVLGISLLSCKKEEEIISESLTYDGLNGALEGKVTGFTYGDSTSFSFDYKHIYESDWDESWWRYADVAATSKTTADVDLVDVWVERHDDLDWDAYSYIWIEDWDLNGDIADADIEIYVQEYAPVENSSISYYQEVYQDDITVNSASFNKETGKFSISLTAKVQEGDGDGNTGNPGTITMSYSGIILSNDIINKQGK